MRVLNNKGFTLIEILAVLVILVAIMGIAIPTITSSMERTKEKQNNAKKEMLVPYAEEYVEDNKNEIYKNLGNNISCYIPIDTLKYEGYLVEDANLDVDGNDFKGYIIFNKEDNTYKYSDTESDNAICLITTIEISLSQGIDYYVSPGGILEKKDEVFDIGYAPIKSDDFLELANSSNIGYLCMSGPSGYGTQKQCSTVCKVLETEIDSEDTNKIYFGCELLYANS